MRSWDIFEWSCELFLGSVFAHGSTRRAANDLNHSMVLPIKQPHDKPGGQYSMDGSVFHWLTCPPALIAATTTVSLPSLRAPSLLILFPWYALCQPCLSVSSESDLQKVGLGKDLIFFSLCKSDSKFMKATDPPPPHVWVPRHAPQLIETPYVASGCTLQK